MDTIINGAVIGAIAVVAAVVWREIKRINIAASAREDRLMSLAESLAQRFESLAGQYETLALDVHDIKANLNGRDAA
ncbi:hypothetical protein ACFTAO_12770 [Paenibacillus rhizoplanae]|uniref:Uncharacterized protein n=1 Tax=Paenibacillus rhizoplanae TaxID=1917181 RepID=A0ABW5FLR1_9BACL